MINLDIEEIQNLVKKSMSMKRYEHSLEVAKMSYKLAKHYHLDAKKAYLMGLLHDLTKEFDKDWEDWVMKTYYKDYCFYARPVYHQFTVSYYVNHYLHVYDKKFLKVLRNHTTGKSTNKYAMIVYVADKIEPTRKFQDPIANRLAFYDLNLARKRILANTKIYLKEKGALNG